MTTTSTTHTITALRLAFDEVLRGGRQAAGFAKIDDWRGRVDSIVRVTAVESVEEASALFAEAVAHYTATIPEVVHVHTCDDGSHVLRIRGLGYTLGPAGP
jgi:hypothetical protein